jgi:hypothetical protein
VPIVVRSQTIGALNGLTIRLFDFPTGDVPIAAPGLVSGLPADPVEPMDSTT